MELNKVKVYFIANTSLFSGLATTNRLLSLAKGIVKNGSFAKIIIINPTEKHDSQHNEDNHGFIDGVEYEYLSDSIFWPKNKVSIFFIYIKSLIKLISKITFLNKNEKPDSIIFMNILSLYIISIFPILKTKKIIILQERNEFPVIQRNKNIFQKIDKFINRKLALKLLDGMLLITKELKSYFKKYVRKSCFLQHIPMTVDYERFQTENPTPISNRYVAYTGYMWGNKDGLTDLLKAFALVKNKYPNLILCLIGDISDKKEFNKLNNLAKFLDIKKNIVFTGQIDRKEMPTYLSNADLLLLARPNNIQARGGFPTKLGEYLTTGIPVVATKVGEIPEYLFDGFNAFLAEPDDFYSFGLKMLEALDDYNKAKKVGANGRKLVDEVFSYKVQGLRVIKSIIRIQKEKYYHNPK
jgi:glycosyltransferase involved in cell wall biosynthesis